MICLLAGHTPITVQGKPGTDREGREAVICERCGKAMDDSDDHARRKSYEFSVSVPRGYEAVRRERMR